MPAQYDTIREYNAACRRRQVYERVKELGNTEWKLPPREMMKIAKQWNVSRTSIYNDLKLIGRMSGPPPVPGEAPAKREPAKLHTLPPPPPRPAASDPFSTDSSGARPITDPFDFSVALETGEGTVFSELSHTERLNFIAAMAAHLITSPFSNGSLKGKGIDTLVKVTEQMRTVAPKAKTGVDGGVAAARERLQRAVSRLPPAMQERLQNVG